MFCHFILKYENWPKTEFLNGEIQNHFTILPIDFELIGVIILLRWRLNNSKVILNWNVCENWWWCLLECILQLHRGRKQFLCWKHICWSDGQKSKAYKFMDITNENTCSTISIKLNSKFENRTHEFLTRTYWVERARQTLFHFLVSMDDGITQMSPLLWTILRLQRAQVKIKGIIDDLISAYLNRLSVRRNIQKNWNVVIEGW